MSKPHDSRAGSTPIPWLSTLLLLAFVAFSVHARLQLEELSSAGSSALDAARDYFLAHPYLEPGSALSARLEASVVARARAEYAQHYALQIPTPPGVIRRQQGELDAQIALASIGALPARSVALAPGTRPAQAWLAYPLLHVNNAVLIGNGLLLLFFGLYLERSLGIAVFGALAVWITLAGAAGWTIVAPRGAAYGLVGSTPLLAGLAAAFAVRFADRRGEGFYFSGLLVGLLWLALPPYATATWSYAPLDLLAGPAPAPITVYVPCLAAMIAALLACAAAWMAGIGNRAGETAKRDPRVRRALRARDAGRPREALELLSQHLAAEPDAYEAALAAYEVATQLGRDAEITAALLRVIRIELRRGLAAAAIDHWLELVRGGIPARTEASLLIHVALLLRDHDHKAEAVRALRFALEHSDDRENHVIAMKIARAARGLDPDTTETAAWRALGSIDLSLSDRQALEGLIGEMLATPAARAAWLARADGKAPAQPEAAAAASRITVVDFEPDAAARPAAIEIETTNARVLDAVIAVPLEIADEGVEIQTQQGQKKLVRFQRIEAVAVAAVHGIGPKPVILVDLVLNWMTPKSETLRVIRLRGDRFDPRRVLTGHATATDALRAFVKLVLERSGAVALPDPEAALGRPFASFEELAIYQRAVLLVEGAPGKGL
jgi:membrane associated rhomboid family serine protease